MKEASPFRGMGCAVTSSNNSLLRTMRYWRRAGSRFALQRLEPEAILQFFKQGLQRTNEEERSVDADNRQKCSPAISKTVSNN